MRTKAKRPPLPGEAPAPRGLSAPRPSLKPDSASSFPQRLAVVAERAGGTISLADRAGLSRTMVYDYLSGESEPSRERLVALANAAEVSVEWLATGEGSMEKGEAALVRSPEELANSFLVPRYDVRAAAGAGAIIESERIVDYLAFKMEWLRRTINAAPGNLLLISAVGDSMEPEIKSGDLLLVDSGDTRIRDHAIYVLAFGGELVVKRLQRRRDGTVLIISDNPAYKAEEVPPHELESLRVVGRVVWVGGVI